MIKCNLEVFQKLSNLQQSGLCEGQVSSVIQSYRAVVSCDVVNLLLDCCHHLWILQTKIEAEAESFRHRATASGEEVIQCYDQLLISEARI